MDLRRLRTVLPAAGVLAAVVVPAVAGCGGGRPCPGQCGPPFQLRVVFRSGTSAQAGRAVLRACAVGNREVERIGPVRLSPLPGGGRPEQHAIVYTRSLDGGGAASRRLAACLNRAPVVRSAGYPD